MTLYLSDVPLAGLFMKTAIREPDLSKYPTLAADREQTGERGKTLSRVFGGAGALGGALGGIQSGGGSLKKRLVRGAVGAAASGAVGFGLGHVMGKAPVNVNGKWMSGTESRIVMDAALHRMGGKRIRFNPSAQQRAHDTKSLSEAARYVRENNL